MSVYERLAKRASAFRQMTGLSVAEFEGVYEQVGGKIETYHAESLKQRARKREVGGGGQYRNDSRERLLMRLIWLKLYPSYEVLGFLFDLHKSNIGRNLHSTLNVLEQELGYTIPREFKRGRKVTLPKFMADFPEVVGIVDATEPSVPKTLSSKKPIIRVKKNDIPLKPSLLSDQRARF